MEYGIYGVPLKMELPLPFLQANQRGYGYEARNNSVGINADVDWML